MNIWENIQYRLICIYMIVLPFFPSKYKFKNIPINGDSILGIVILFYFVNLVFNSNARKRLFMGIRLLLHDIFGVTAIIIFAIMAFSVTYSTDNSLAISETIRFGTYLCLYFIIKWEIRDKAIKNLLIWFMLISVLVSIVGLLGIPFGYGVEKQASKFGTMMRIESTLENSNNLGAFLVLSIFSFLTLFLKEKEWKKKVLYGTGTFLVAISLLLTQSRNAWLAFAAGCLCYVILYNWKSIIYFIIIFVGMLFIPQVRDRIAQFNDPSQNGSRIELWKTALKMIKAQPLLGVGNGNYATKYDQYYTGYKDISYKAHGQFHPHNIFLKIQSELGVMGTLAFIGFIGSMFFKLVKVVKTTANKMYNSLYKGFIISIITFMFMNCLDNFFSAPKVIAFFWIIIALAEAINNDNKIEASI